MKKLFIASAMLLMTGGVFANDVAEERDNFKKEEVASNTCCTATLTYRGRYYDHEESCNTSFTYDQNCGAARATLLKRNPAAAVALEKDVN